MRKVERIVVLGSGSAGLMAALALKMRLPKLAIHVIHSAKIGIIGVGEGSTPALTRFLHEYLRIAPGEFFALAHPTWKLGLRFEWGPRPYFNYNFWQGQLMTTPPGLPALRAHYCWEEMGCEDPLSALMSQDMAFERRANGDPALHPHLAYHLENEQFVAFLHKKAAETGVIIQEEEVTGAERSEDGIAALLFAGGRRLAADLFVDASGFRSELLGRTLEEPFTSYAKSLFCDRAVVGGWKRSGPEDERIRPYTLCETMEAGWCWRIEHLAHINRGYVYSSAFISDSEAEEEFRRKNPKVGATRVVPFVSGRYRRFWVGNVVAIGNAGGFVEPLEATALGVISFQCRTLAETLEELDGGWTDAGRHFYNQTHAVASDDIRDFLAVHYRFNTRLDTPFWRHCRENTELAGAEKIVALFRENGPTFWFESVIPRESQFGRTGYLLLLWGQKVPHQGRAISVEEKALWAVETAKYRAMAARGFTVNEALRTVTSPNWRWTFGENSSAGR